MIYLPLRISVIANVDMGCCTWACLCLQVIATGRCDNWHVRPGKGIMTLMTLQSLEIQAVYRRHIEVNTAALGNKAVFMGVISETKKNYINMRLRVILLLCGGPFTQHVEQVGLIFISEFFCSSFFFLYNFIRLKRNIVSINIKQSKRTLVDW